MDSNVCDECDMPFMKQKKTNRLLCVACQQALGQKLLVGGSLDKGENKNKLILVCKGGSEKYSITITDGEMKLGPKIEQTPIIDKKPEAQKEVKITKDIQHRQET